MSNYDLKVNVNDTFNANNLILLAQSAGLVAYTDWISAEGQDSLSECPETQSVGAIEYTGWISPEEQDSPNTNPLLPLLKGPLWLRVESPDRFLSMGCID